ncbi:MAG: site-2 protease family protein, partial [Anaerolineales bacterium]
PVTGHGYQEGQGILYWALKRAIFGPIPDGSDVFLSPAALAGWVGFLVTMINLFPVGQLDGGHIAYALFGPRQNRYSQVMRWSILALVPINFVWRMVPVLRGAPWKEALESALAASPSWVVWFLVLTVLERLSGGGHPPTEPSDLSPVRRAVGIGTLVLFVLLFMPTPLSSY